VTVRASSGVPELIDGLEHFYRTELGLEGAVPLHEPWFSGNERAYVNEALDTNWVSSVGPFVDRFERACAEISGAREAVAIVNGTCALHILLIALGVRPGDLVIAPAISFAGTANAIAHAGAEPLFVDVEAGTLSLDPQALAALLREECTGSGADLRHRPSGRRVAAVVPVHIFGHPADMAAILAVAAERELIVVEDAAESVGSSYAGKPCGALARAGILSFNGNKTVTAGGGGAVVTNDVELARRVRHLSTTARVAAGFEFDHDEVGYNYRLPSLNAALGCAQLERLEAFVRVKRALAARYQAMFEERFVAEPAGTQSNYWLNAVVLDDRDQRDQFLAETNARGFQTRPVWRPLPLLAMYERAPRAASGIAQALDGAGRIVNLPSSPKMAASLR
jgi:perosamine synthetase